MEESEKEEDINIVKSLSDDDFKRMMVRMKKEASDEKKEDLEQTLGNKLEETIKDVTADMKADIDNTKRYIEEIKNRDVGEVAACTAEAVGKPTKEQKRAMNKQEEKMKIELEWMAAE